jgi:hypothetical protein
MNRVWEMKTKLAVSGGLSWRGKHWLVFDFDQLLIGEKTPA